MNFAIQVQRTIDLLQKELPNLAATYPDHTWESTSGDTSFAVILCHNGKYFGGQLLRVLTVVGVHGDQPRYFLEIFKGRSLEFVSLNEVIDYLHEMGKAFSKNETTPHPPG